ncbi:MAG TPA: hypothetical protein VK137_14495, partial [Planctomycetaceae bacterium]|nr:hypothetical protein [Planctomycetaceae bacterium]
MWRNPSINEVDYTFPDFGPSLSYTTLQGIKPSFHRPELVHRSRLGRRSAPNQIQQFGDFDVDLNGDRIADAIWMDLDSDLVATNGWPIRLSQPTDGGGGFGGVASGGFIVADGRIPWIDAYGRYPVVAVHPLTGVMQDLPSYAPGLQTWPADRLAIVEQAATTKPNHGEVDAEARRLIEKARSLGWEKVRLISRNALASGSDRGKPDASAFRLIDGSGRFVVEREVGEGLKEQVINDGTTLWHLYPEIGLGAKRTLSRFHQSAIQSLIPWYVPSADDLSVDADVKAIGERTIRVTRLKRDEPPTPQIAFDLIFAEDGRLRESRVIDIAANKVLARQTVAADGMVRVFDAEDKLVGEVKYERQPVESPNLVPTTNDLVVLPLPYRSAAGVPVSVPVNLQTNAPDFAKLSDDNALALLATYFAEARSGELVTFIEQRYTAKGDHRIGLAVLLASVVPQNPLVANATKQHPDLPLAKFLEQFAGFPAQGNLNGTLDAGDAASPFLERVCSAYNHYVRWATDRAAARERPAADIQQELSGTLLFIRDCRSVDLAAKLLSTVDLGLKRTERMNATFARQLNDATAALSEERGIPAFGRTARIEWL